MVERFFRDISENRLRRGVFTSVPELIVAIDAYIAHHNANPKPFIWTTSARDILQEVIRANSRLSPKQNATLHRGAKHLVGIISLRLISKLQPERIAHDPNVPSKYYRPPRTA